MLFLNTEYCLPLEQSVWGTRGHLEGRERLVKGPRSTDGVALFRMSNFSRMVESSIPYPEKTAISTSLSSTSSLHNHRYHQCGYTRTTSR